MIKIKKCLLGLSFALSTLFISNCFAQSVEQSAPEAATTSTSDSRTSTTVALPTETQKPIDAIVSIKTDSNKDTQNVKKENVIAEVKPNLKLDDFKGENIFVLFSALFVLLMTLPGIALFYAGLVRKKNVISILVQTTFIFTIITLLWFAVGYSLALVDGGNSFFGSFKKIFLMNIQADSYVKKGEALISEYVYILYHLAFAIVTCAIIIGSAAERLKLKALVMFSCGWLVLIYCPLAFMLWSGHGWAESYGVLDWAGGLVVHVNAGVSGLVIAYLVEKRKDFGQPMQPHNLGLVFIGTAFLVVGWAGFNGGSSFDSVFLGAKAIVCTFIAAAAGAFMWAFLEKITRGSVSIIGVCSGLLVGLVAVTPAAGYIDPTTAFLFGIVPVPFCLGALKLIKNKIKVDDTLDVFAVHGVGGIVGSIMTGYFAADGKFLPQLYTTIGVVFGVAILSYLIMVIVLLICRGEIRHGSDEEEIGLDLVEHGEELE